MIITFNMQAEHGSVIVGTIETRSTDEHMALVLVSEIFKIVVIKSFFF